MVLILLYQQFYFFSYWHLFLFFNFNLLNSLYFLSNINNLNMILKSLRLFLLLIDALSILNFDLFFSWLDQFNFIWSNLFEMILITQRLCLHSLSHNIYCFRQNLRLDHSLFFLSMNFCLLDYLYLGLFNFMYFVYFIRMDFVYFVWMYFLYFMWMDFMWMYVDGLTTSRINLISFNWIIQIWKRLTYFNFDLFLNFSNDLRFILRLLRFWLNLMRLYHCKNRFLYFRCLVLIQIYRLAKI